MERNNYLWELLLITSYVTNNDTVTVRDEGEQLEHGRNLILGNSPVAPWTLTSSNFFVINVNAL